MNLIYRHVPRIVIATLAGDWTTTVVTAGDVSTLKWSVEKNSQWFFLLELQLGCNGAGGMKFAFTGPAGAAIRAAVMPGNLGGSTNFRSTRINAFSSLTADAYCTLNSSALFARIAGRIDVGSTAGVIQFQAASVTDTQTSTIFKESFLQAIKA